MGTGLMLDLKILLVLDFFINQASRPSKFLKGSFCVGHQQFRQNLLAACNSAAYRKLLATYCTLQWTSPVVLRNKINHLCLLLLTTSTCYPAFHHNTSWQGRCNDSLKKCISLRAPFLALTLDSTWCILLGSIHAHPLPVLVQSTLYHGLSWMYVHVSLLFSFALTGS